MKAREEGVVGQVKDIGAGLKRCPLKQSWVLSAITVGSIGPWFTADPMQPLCACHATAMCIQLMLFLGAIQEPFYVTGVLHSLPWSAA